MLAQGFPVAMNAALRPAIAIFNARIARSRFLSAPKILFLNTNLGKLINLRKNWINDVPENRVSVLQRVQRAVSS